MKKDVKLKSKTRNSFIYFQLGLIGTMLIVLFVLEFQFKEAVKEIKTFTLNEPIDEPFDGVFTIIENNDTEVKPEKVVKPQVKVPLDVTEVEVKDNDEQIKETDINTQDNVSSNEGSEIKNDETNNTSGNVVSKPVNPTIFNVERLPMFPECAGLSRTEQKACFDEQLMKAVMRNLSYPDVDLENGKQGTALIEFVIDEKGNITNVKALDNKRATVTMQKAAEKAVKKLPKLIPAKMGEDNVRIKYSIPISFRIQ
ncbi:energy transducer TonB [Flavobacterium okayamense]|uniref:TonB C-terminal domain-containing protein n=1 Tax=Flavobacterium okayamense TaxID=2830782 RepID=A0ABM7S3W2_9FLAO|nr:energy transducer TonB [Flavobacterium okayamense]BCY28151.1 hypothetical protein KK2020170_10190 [Flavobacterium okayamense]